MKIMSNTKRLLGMCVLLWAISCSTMAQTYLKTNSGMKAVINSIDVEVKFYNPATVQIIKSPVGWDYSKESLSVIEKPQQVKLTTRQNGEVVTLKSDVIEVSLNLNTVVISFSKEDGSLLLQEKGAPVFTEFDDAGVNTYSVKQAFSLEADEPIYGLGILQNGKMSQRNQTKNLVQGNVEDVVPFIQSVKGYGVYWDNYSPTVFADNQDETSFTSEVGDCVDYFFMYGGNADGVIAQMRALTGNQLGVLLCDYLLSQPSDQARAIVKTIVTTDMARAVAQHYGCECVDTFTGFKHLSHACNQLLARDVLPVLGFEEAIGYRLNPDVCDKDGLSAALVTCQMACRLHADGLTLHGQYDLLSQRLGYYAEKTVSVTLPGTSGAKVIAACMQSLRQSPPTLVMQDKVTDFSDCLPDADVLMLSLANECRIVVRPSGTEPKIKLYTLARGQTAKDAHARAQAYADHAQEVLRLKEL